MNINLLNAVNALKEKEGADIFDNPGALEQLLETARDEPRAQIKTLITACVRDFHKELQAAAVTERAACKERLAQKLHNDEALDLTHCRNTLDLIEAALFGAPAPVCAKCGAELKAHWKVCPECGTAVGGAKAAEAPVCAGCGAELKAKWKACPKCGTAVQGAAAEPVLSATVSSSGGSGYGIALIDPPPATAEPVPVCAGCRAELKAHWKTCPECGMTVQGAAAEPAMSAAVSSSGGAGYGIALIDPPPAKPRRKRRKRSPPKQNTAPPPQPTPAPPPPPESTSVKESTLVPFLLLLGPPVIFPFAVTLILAEFLPGVYVGPQGAIPGIVTYISVVLISYLIMLIIDKKNKP
jgi:predicted RNA-binding Zn-ribbon protein involved in translation (DUF1610 family)